MVKYILCARNWENALYIISHSVLTALFLVFLIIGANTERKHDGQGYTAERWPSGNPHTV